jgi:type VI protein secretion system component VasK
MDFADIIWFIIVAYALIAFLMVMVWFVSDILRDPGSSGLQKAVWILALVVLPLVTALVYLVVRGRAMSERLLVRSHAAQLRREAADPLPVEA